MKKILKAVWDEFIYGGHLLALGASSIVLTSSYILFQQIDFLSAIIAYFGIQLVYKQDRLAEDRNESNKHGIAILIYGALCLLLLLLTPPITFIVGILLFGSGLLYGSFFKPLSKKIPAFKNFFVPLSYSLLVFLSTTRLKEQITLSVVLVAVFVFIRLFTAVAYYDIKDIEQDKANKIQTLVVLIKGKSFSNLLNVLNILSVVPLIIGIYYSSLPEYGATLVFLLPYFWLYSYLSRENKNIAFNSYVLCDGEFIIWFPLILIGMSLWT